MYVLAQSGDAILAAGSVSALANLREFCRSSAWHFNPLVLVNNTQSVSNRQCADASRTGALLSAAAATYCAVTYGNGFELHTQHLMAFAPAAIAGVYTVGVSRKNPFQVYAAVMWDYPRKRGGPTITSRIVEKAETAISMGVARPNILRRAADITAKIKP